MLTVRQTAVGVIFLAVPLLADVSLQVTVQYVFHIETANSDTPWLRILNHARLYITFKRKYFLACKLRGKRKWRARPAIGSSTQILFFQNGGVCFECESAWNEEQFLQWYFRWIYLLKRVVCILLKQTKCYSCVITGNAALRPVGK